VESRCRGSRKETAPGRRRSIIQSVIRAVDGRRLFASAARFAHSLVPRTPTCAQVASPAVWMPMSDVDGAILCLSMVFVWRLLWPAR
jgi:hypothetical protein